MDLRNRVQRQIFSVEPHTVQSAAAPNSSHGPRVVAEHLPLQELNVLLHATRSFVALVIAVEIGTKVIRCVRPVKQSAAMAASEVTCKTATSWYFRYDEIILTWAIIGASVRMIEPCFVLISRWGQNYCKLWGQNYSKLKTNMFLKISREGQLASFSPGCGPASLFQRLQTRKSATRVVTPLQLQIPENRRVLASALLNLESAVVKTSLESFPSVNFIDCM